MRYTLGSRPAERLNLRSLARACERGWATLFSLEGQGYSEQRDARRVQDIDGERTLGGIAAHFPREITQRCICFETGLLRRIEFTAFAVGHDAIIVIIVKEKEGHTRPSLARLVVVQTKIGRRVGQTAST